MSFSHAKAMVLVTTVTRLCVDTSANAYPDSMAPNANGIDTFVEQIVVGITVAIVCSALPSRRF